MNKNRFFLAASFILIQHMLWGQADTLKPCKGFTNYREASDSLIARLIASKPGNMEDYLISKNLFIKGVRQKDTITPENFIAGTYYSYEARTKKSFNKTYKKIRKKPFYIKTSQRDSVYLYSNTGNPLLHRVEVHLKKKKMRYYIKFQLWNIDGVWYYYDKFLLEKTE